MTVSMSIAEFHDQLRRRNAGALIRALRDVARADRHVILAESKPHAWAFWMYRRTQPA